MSMAIFKTDRSGRYKMDESVVLVEDMCDADNDTPTDETCEQCEDEAEPFFSECCFLMVAYLVLWIGLLAICKLISS